jgi:hypothetical protein
MSTSASIDVSLLSFLRSADEREEELLLTRLISEYADPTVRRVLRHKLKFYSNYNAANYSNPDLEEIYYDVRLHLLQKLRDLKRDPSHKPISNLQSYITSIAHHRCDEYLRRKYPSRRHLKDRVRYQLTMQPEFRLWENKEIGWLAGLSIWGGRQCEVLKEVDAKPNGSLLKTLSEKLQDVDAPRLKLQQLLKIILTASGHPLELDSLTGLIAKLQGVEELSVKSLTEENIYLVEAVIEPQSEPDVVLQYRQLLQYLWSEICQLSRRQRIALLFNLKSPNGVNVITLLPVTQVATFEQIAEALEIPVELFESIWSQLPMDDLRIAEYLGATRQQVINLRKNAREKLSRRMKALESLRPQGESQKRSAR